MNLDALRGALGSDPNKFPRDVLVRAPEWFDSQVDLLVEATTGAMSGRSLRGCQLLFRSIRSRDIQDWYIGVGQWSGTYRAALRNIERPKTAGGVDYPRQLRYPLLERDGYRCRYCGSRVIGIDELKAAAKILEAPELVGGSGNRGRHGIRLIVQATFDHVVPAARFEGEGVNDMENLVTSCWPCNFGKADFLLEELNLELMSPRSASGWDGLCDLRPHRRRAH
jgi:5-methylcytosine-specific restriction endonuclease McrA